MANTRQAAKRARQSIRRQARNQIVKSITKTSLKNALEALTAEKVDAEKAAVAYRAAVKTLDKSVTKGALPRRRASRKIARLYALAKQKAPQILTAAKPAKA